MEQNFVLRVDRKSWVSFQLVNISHFEHVAFRLKPTICGLFLPSLTYNSILTITKQQGIRMQVEIVTYKFVCGRICGEYLINLVLTN